MTYLKNLNDKLEGSNIPLENIELPIKPYVFGADVCRGLPSSFHMIQIRMCGFEYGCACVAHNPNSCEQRRMYVLCSYLLAFRLAGVVYKWLLRVMTIYMASFVDIISTNIIADSYKSNNNN